MIWNGEKYDQKWFSVIQNGRRQPFCEKKSTKNKICVLIWNSEKCDRKWFSVIQNGRRQLFCEKNKKLCIDLKWREMPSKVIFAHPKWQISVIQNGHQHPNYKKNKKIIVAYCHFVKSKLRIDLKRSKVIFGHPKWPKSDFQNGHLKKNLLHIAILWKK